MREKIQPFNESLPSVLYTGKYIMEHAPVKNLTEREVMQTMKLFYLERHLKDEKRTSHFSVTIYKEDERLADWSADDKFLALLLDADCRQQMLMSKRCRYCFGQTPYYWRKVAGRCVIITTKSQPMEGDYGGKYFGRGWIIAPHIQTLRRWIKENTEIKSL